MQAFILDLELADDERRVVDPAGHAHNLCQHGVRVVLALVGGALVQGRVSSKYLSIIELHFQDWKTSITRYVTLCDRLLAHTLKKLKQIYDFLSK